MQRRADGRWQRKIKIGNKSVFFYSTEDTEKKAIKDIERQLIAYQDKITIKTHFSYIADEWADFHFETVEHNTLKQYKPALRDVKSFFKDMPVQDITSQKVDLFVKSYSKKGYAQKTVKTRLLVLNLIMKYAVINGQIPFNPCQYITVPKNLPKSKREALTDTEKNIVNESIDRTFGFFAYFLMYTGLRKGEACALRYSDIDFDKKILRVNKTVEWVGNVPRIKNNPKTEAGIREVPILDCIYNKIPKKKEDELLFPNSDGELIRNGNFTRLWDKYRAETGLSITPHQLRHTFATILYDANVDIKTAQHILGHSNIQTTMDIYTHLTASRKNNASELLNNFINNSF